MIARSAGSVQCWGQLQDGFPCITRPGGEISVDLASIQVNESSALRAASDSAVSFPCVSRFELSTHHCFQFIPVSILAHSGVSHFEGVSLCLYGLSSRRFCDSVRWIKLVEVTGEARYELAGFMLQLSERVEKACTACTREDAPLIIELWAGCQQVNFACDDWRYWFDQTREMPLEACTPEPNLFALTALPVARPGSVPPHVYCVRATGDALTHLVSTPLFYTNHRHFFRNLELF